MKDFNKYRREADLLKAIAHPVRLCILEGLIDEECNVGKMQECLGLPQANVSQHLAVLRARGIVAGHREGLEVRYSVVDPRVARVVRSILGGEGSGVDG